MPATPTVPVLAVLVSSDGARWLPEVLAGLAAQTVRPATVVAVDTGSRDDSGGLLRAAVDTVLVRPGATFGAAVAAAVDEAPPAAWVWLLHDDCAPDPDALEQLLAADPGTAVRGPKAVDWDDPRTLLEVGLTTDGAGRRLPGVEPGEQDQGQRDRPRDVLAVGTAGMLVRRDVWLALDGLDPALPVFGDDLDLGRRATAAGHRVGVVPAARVRHARAATTGRRRLPGRAGALDRRAQAYVLLAHAPAAQVVPAVLRVVAGALGRALLLLLGRRFRAAGDELAGLAVLARPDLLVRARRTRGGPTPRELLPPPFARVRATTTTLLDRAASTGGAGLRRPGTGVLLTAGLAVVALVAERSLLTGGALAGGRLLPAPQGAGDLLRAYADGGPAATAVLAGLSAVLLGRVPLAVDLLLLASVPAAGAVAWWAAGRVVARPVLRLWAAATWALLPVATGAIAAGRLDAAAVQIALPAGLVAGHAVATRDPRGRWQRAWALGLALTAVAALVPLAWPFAAVLLLGLAGERLLRAQDRAAAARPVLAVLVVLAVPLLVLQPQSLDAAALLHGPGRLGGDVTDPALAAWRLPLLQPGGPGLPAAVVTVGLLLGALAALLRPDRTRAVTGAWAVALTGLAAAVVLSRLTVAGEPVWPGTALQVAAAGLLLAALVAADGLPEQLQRNAFGRRQLAAVLVVATAAAVPALCASAWVLRGADGPLQRGTAPVLPAFATAELAQTGLRALVLEPQPDGSVAYAVTDADGPRLGDPPALALDGVVADLLSPRGSDAAEALSTRAVRYVSLPGGSPADERALDAQPGLLRQSGGALWRVSAPARRLQLLSPGAATTALRDRAPTVAGEAVGGALPAGEDGRLLVLAEPRGSGWRAQVDGERLEERTAFGWAQAWAVPADGGALVVERDGRPLGRQALALGAVLVLAGPGGPRRRGLERVR